MSAHGTKDRRRSRTVESLSCPPNCRAGGHDVVDQQDGATGDPGAGRETPRGKFEALGAGVAGLTTETVSSERENGGLLESLGDSPGQQRGCCPRSSQPSPRVRGNRNDEFDLRHPCLGGDHGCKTITERCREVVPSSVLEGENRCAQDPVVLAPCHRCTLSRGIVDAGEAWLAVVLCGNATTRAGCAGSRDGERPAWPAQTALISVEWMIAVWTHAGKQGFNRRGQRPPRLHGAHRNRVWTAVEDRRPQF